MRQVFFYGAISLDGFLSSATDDLQWLFDTSLDKEFDISDFEDRIGTVVMGHTTYRETQRLSGAERNFPNKEKIVFSRSEKGNNIIEGNYVSGDPVAVINRLKAEAGQAIWVVGGGEIVTTLLKHDLIDELWIQIAPVVLGTGKRLFEETEQELKRFELVSVDKIGQLSELHLKRIQKSSTSPVN
ncbi:dihydrofolate reductase family protein [Lactococcus chungangensis]|uniref:dihydrofolate reductase family protein n=1 Tax=Pseudolactococcus chungangensis TaxID=451457 RepID=UPI00373591A5